jgi:pimeloyl-ACP methyl ester carboxylesterase
MTADAAAAGASGRSRARELVLLHGQPGSAADWPQLAGQLPAHLHAIAVDRPGYGASPLAACGFAANARAVLDELDARGIQRAVLVGHSYGGGVALSAASLAPHRVEAVVLLASIGPGCLNGWDRLLAAPGAGALCAVVAWRLTPWFARARLARIGRRRGGPLDPGEHVNWQIWGHARRDHGPLWRTFLAEQRFLLHELDELVSAVPSVRSPVLLLADPQDTMVPVATSRRLAEALPDARLHLVEGAGHHLPRRAPAAVAASIAEFVAALDDREQAGRSAVGGGQPQQLGEGGEDVGGRSGARHLRVAEREGDAGPVSQGDGQHGDPLGAEPGTEPAAAHPGADGVGDEPAPARVVAERVHPHLGVPDPEVP